MTVDDLRLLIRDVDGDRLFVIEIGTLAYRVNPADMGICWYEPKTPFTGECGEIHDAADKEQDTFERAFALWGRG